jgi:hypothetical protein
MLSRKLVKTDEIELSGQVYPVRYYEAETTRGVRRYCAELVVGPADRIIVDGGALMDLEWRLARLVPATIYSRMLVARAA